MGHNLYGCFICKECLEKTLIPQIEGIIHEDLGGYYCDVVDCYNEAYYELWLKEISPTKFIKQAHGKAKQ